MRHYYLGTFAHNPLDNFLSLIAEFCDADSGRFMILLDETSIVLHDMALNKFIISYPLNKTHKFIETLKVINNDLINVRVYNYGRNEQPTKQETYSIKRLHRYFGEGAYSFYESKLKYFNIRHGKR